MDPVLHSAVRFGPFELDLNTHELRKLGLRIRLSEQPVQILLLLLERAGETVTREELQQRLWPGDTFVDFDAGLNSAIKKLRDTLGDPADTPRFIETVPRRGYRFIFPPEKVAAAPRRWLGRQHGNWVLPTTIAATVILAAWVTLTLVGRIAGGKSAVSGPIRIASLAVLPFENLSGTPGQEYLADGITEAVTNNLAQFKALRVTPRNSVTRYKRPGVSLAQMARDLNVDGIVQGTIVRSGNRVRVTVQLIEASTDLHLWAQNYDREVRDVLALEIELAEAIAAAIPVEVRPDERRRLSLQAVRPEAYEEYLKGRFYWNSRTAGDLLRAAEHFQNAVSLDPKYAPAYSGLSDTYRLFDMAAVAAPRDCMPKAEAAARSALALDDTLAEAHVSLAGVLYRYHWNWAAAEREFTRALEFDPDYAEGASCPRGLSADAPAERRGGHRGATGAPAQPAVGSD